MKRSPLSAARGAAFLVLYALAAQASPPALETQRAAATGSLPKGASLSPDGRRLYVTNYGQLDHRNVSVYDTANLTLLRTFDVPGIVVESVVSPDGATLYVSNFRRDTVQFLDANTGHVRREVRVGHHPKVLVLTADGRRLFAANWGSRDVTEVDTAAGTVVRTLAAEENPRGMAVRADGTLYIANFGSRSLEVYEGPDRARHRHLANVCRIPRHLSLSPDGAQLYISCMTDAWLTVLDTATERVLRRVTVGRGPKSNDVSADGRYVFTANYGGSSVTIVDTTDWSTRTLDVPGMDAASGIVAARSGVRAYVTGWYDNHVYEVGVAGSGPRYTITAAQRAQTLRNRAFHAQNPVE